MAELDNGDCFVLHGVIVLLLPQTSSHSENYFLLRNLA
jgi:hypothetical protein